VRNDWIFKEAPPFVEAFKAKFKHEFAMLLQFFSLCFCSFGLAVFSSCFFLAIYIYPVGASASCLLKNLCEELVQHHVIWNTNVDDKC
jgi:mannitol-specific phosphotransferase system IIBC component